MPSTIATLLQASGAMLKFSFLFPVIMMTSCSLKATGRCNDRVTLVGHSYGGLYAAQAAEHAAVVDPEHPLNVVTFMTPFIGAVGPADGERSNLAKDVCRRLCRS